MKIDQILKSIETEISGLGLQIKFHKNWATTNIYDLRVLFKKLDRGTDKVFNII